VLAGAWVVCTSGAAGAGLDGAGVATDATTVASGWAGAEVLCVFSLSLDLRLTFVAAGAFVVSVVDSVEAGGVTGGVTGEEAGAGVSVPCPSCFLLNLDPAEPVDPVDPVDPDDPVDEFDNVDSVDPLDTDAEDDPDDELDTVDSVDEVDPVDPDDTVDPVDPVDPVVELELSAATSGLASGLASGLTSDLTS
jgi:hypothetical protein